uniref:Uncharacterized protein n=1 Tax=Anguilla anguilla TaxID=7936 RepID=A0A0E9SG22_ANGAN
MFALNFNSYLFPVSCDTGRPDIF